MCKQNNYESNLEIYPTSKIMQNSSVKLITIIIIPRCKRNVLGITVQMTLLMEYFSSLSTSTVNHWQHGIAPKMLHYDLVKKSLKKSTRDP